MSECKTAREHSVNAWNVFSNASENRAPANLLSQRRTKTIIAIETIEMPRIAGEVIDRVIEAREGVLYFTVNHVYKVFNNAPPGDKLAAKPYDVLGDFKKAEDEGVPVPSTAMFRAQLQDDYSIRDVRGICSKRVCGTFFQLSRPGHTTVLINEIRRAPNHGLLKIILAGLEAAARAGLSDPQGFISTTSNPPLCFIDVHFGIGRNAAFDDSINAARARLAELARRS